MRIILFILLFVSQLSFAQVGNKNLFFRSAITAPSNNEFNWNSLQVQAPTTYTGQSNLIIEGKSFTNTNCSNQNGNDLFLLNCSNVIIRNCYFGSSCGMGIAITSSTNVLIENCFFANNKSGVYVDGASQDIIVQDNQAINVHGPFPRGQFVQFNGVTTSASGQCAVRRNEIENFLGESYAEDVINMFNSSGRSGAPIDISENLIRGGGPSLSGGGILLGESSGDWNHGNYNKIYQAGNYIMAVGGGSNNSMTNNIGYLDHTPISVDNWSNVGFVLWAQQAYSLPFDNLTFTNNINFTNTARYGYNPLFYPTAVTGTVQYSNDDFYGAGEESVFLAMMDFPATIIDYVTEDILWQIRDESQQFRVDVIVGGKPPWPLRPTSNAGADQEVTSGTATLSGAASTSSFGKNYRWVQVSGPNTATMSAPLAVTNNLSGLITGTYRFRLEVVDNNGAGDADWVEVTQESIVYFEDVEGVSPFTTYVNQQIETEYGLTASTEQSYNGAKSGRFELRDTDPMNNNGTRAEISFPDATNLHRWYSYAVFFPSTEWEYDDDDEIISQWHQGGGVTPSLVLGTKIDRYRLQIKETPTTTQNIDLGAIIKDAWNTYVFHVIHSSTSDGLIEVWQNGVKILTHNGINMYPIEGDFHSPNWKLGIYKSGWNNENTTDVSIRVNFFDDIRMGNENATYNEMAPSQQ